MYFERHQCRRQSDDYVETSPEHRVVAARRPARRLLVLRGIKRLLPSAPTVASLPHYAGSNPYQSQLNQALARQGVRFLPWQKQARLSHLRCLLAARKIPDVLHQQWIHVDTLRPTLARSLLATALFFLQVGILRGLGVRIVWTLHNKMNHDGAYPRLDQWIRRAMFRVAHAVIVHGETAAAKAADHLRIGNKARSKLRVVPHASYAGIYPDTVDRQEARARFGLSETHFCYGLIGRLQAYKGVEILIDAFRQMPGENLRLIVAGHVASAGLNRWLHEQQTTDSRILLFPERIAEEDLQTYFAAADAVVYPFQDQLTSGSALLAASFGRALVLPGLLGLPPAGCLLFEPGNRTSLLGALRRVSACDTEAMGAANCAAMASPDMSWPTMAARTLAVYRGALAT